MYNAKNTMTTKSRMDLRVHAQHEAVIRRAAECQGRTLTDFVLEAALLQAERVLADRRYFQVDDAAWKKFTEALDRPAAEKPRLRGLLSGPSVLEA